MTFPGYQNFLNQLRSAFQRGGMRRRAGSRQLRPAVTSALESLETRTLLTATLVKDINPNVWSNPEHFVDVNGTLFFTADDGVHGEELWKSDGTSAGTVFVKDINPGTGSSNGFTTDPYMCNVNGILYFSADDGVHGVELWRSDGTDAGTYLVKDIRPGVSPFGPEEMIDLNGTLYFIADDGVHGKELWTSDGTDSGTVMVKDIYPGTFGGVDNTFFSTGLRKFNGKLYFGGDDGTNGEELWTSDGTAAGTKMVINLTGDLHPSWPDLLTESNGVLYFTAHTFANGEELFRTDGTAAGTSLVKDIHPGDSLGNITELVDVNGKLFFTIDDGTHGLEIWKTDGTDAGTSLVKDINPGSTSGIFGIPTQLIALNNMLIFAADDGVNGREIWKSDGTEAGTVMVKDISVGISSSSPDKLISIGKFTYFQAFDIDNGFQIWRTDGTSAGTQMLKTLDPTFNATMPVTTDHMQGVNGVLYFPADDLVTRTELWKWEEATTNHAPVLNASGNPALPTILNTNPGNGMLITDLIASMGPQGSITDVDPGAVKGIAIIGVNNLNGTWQYSLNNGTTWQAVGAASANSARLLAADANTRIRFLPNAGFGGASGISFVAWDQTSGVNGTATAITATGGTTPFSTNKETASITVTSNHAPVLNASGNPTLPTISASSSNTGMTIVDLIASMGPAGSITDVDAGAVKGIAIIGVNNAGGAWQYSLNSGTTWQAVGAASVGSARLLAANGTTRVRYLPNNVNVSAIVGFTFVAWDQTTGSNGNAVAISSAGGATAFSSNKESAFVTVIANHAPVLNANGNPTLPSFSTGTSSNGMLITALIAAMGPAGSITDADPGALKGFAIIGVNNLYGRWEYSLDNGTNWQQVGNSSVTSSRLLAANSTNRIRFVPNTGFKGTVGFTFLAWDQTSGVDGTTVGVGTAGGASAFSTAKENAFVTVTA
ncbi:MAG: ELWxxDGT repeat protein [Planctomycetales bacterium]